MQAITAVVPMVAMIEMERTVKNLPLTDRSISDIANVLYEMEINLNLWARIMRDNCISLDLLLANHSGVIWSRKPNHTSPTIGPEWSGLGQ